MLAFTNSANWWIGVVEDRDDPLKLGRCRVRIFGLHTDDVSELPTIDLPWAVPMQPINSAAISGKGIAPVGPVEGTWVVGWFLDGEDMQQPMMIGTIAGYERPNPLCAIQSQRSVKQQNIATSSDGKPIYDSSGQVVQSTNFDNTNTATNSFIKNNLPPLTADQVKLVMDAISTKESSSTPNGPINTTSSKVAGAQNYGLTNSKGYVGKYQFGYDALALLGYVKSFGAGISTSNSELSKPENWRNADGAPLKEGIGSLEDYFQNPQKQELIMFEYMQYHYNQLKKNGTITTYSDPAYVGGILATAHNGGLGNATNFDSKDGYGTSRSIFYKLGNLALGGDGIVPSSRTAAVGNRDSYAPYHPANIDLVWSDKLNDPVLAKNKGFEDPNKVYPNCEYSGAPDTNKLARGDDSHKSLQRKSTIRKTGVNLANENTTWDQPESPFCARYPYNQVIETEAGHLLEFDNTPGKERVHLYHKNGTFIEVDVNGTMVRKVVGDNYEVIDRNNYVYVKGAHNLTVDGSTKILVKNNAEIEVNGDVNMVGHGDTRINTAGTLDLVGNKVNIMGKNGVNVLSDAGTMKLQAYNINLNAKNKEITLKAKTDVALYAPQNLSLTGGLEVKIAGTVVKTKMGSTNIQDTLLPSLDPSEALSPEIIDLPNLIVPICDRTIVLFDAEEPESLAYRQEQINNGNIKDVEPKAEKRDSSAAQNKTITLCECIDLKEFKGYFPDTIKLSKHFTLGPLTTRSTASSFKIVAQRGLSEFDILCNLKHLAVNCLDPIKDKYNDMVISSGFRVGAKEADHGLGMAADIQFMGGRSTADYYNIVRWIRDNVPYKQLLLEYQFSFTRKSVWIHIALDKTGATSGLRTATLVNHIVKDRNQFVNYA